eukprot:SAG31_NODE_6620_length_1948_cov_2.550027_1_plen_191_part_00
MVALALSRLGYCLDVAAGATRGPHEVFVSPEGDDAQSGASPCEFEAPIARRTDSTLITHSSWVTVPGPPGQRRMRLHKAATLFQSDFRLTAAAWWLRVQPRRKLIIPSFLSFLPSLPSSIPSLFSFLTIKFIGVFKKHIIYFLLRVQPRRLRRCDARATSCARRRDQPPSMSAQAGASSHFGLRLHSCVL